MSRDRSGYKFAKGRNTGLRSKGANDACPQWHRNRRRVMRNDNPCVAVTSANAVSPAISLPVNPASSREQLKTETQGSKCSNKSGSDSKQSKPNCYACKFRGDAPGSAHSSCKHPAFASTNDEPLFSLLSLLAGAGRVAPIQLLSNVCSVVGNAHGIKHGWFQHPFNFDPVWLESCTGYQAKP